MISSVILPLSDYPLRSNQSSTFRFKWASNENLLFLSFRRIPSVSLPTSYDSTLDTSLESSRGSDTGRQSHRQTQTLDYPVTRPFLSDNDALCQQLVTFLRHGHPLPTTHRPLPAFCIPRPYRTRQAHLSYHLVIVSFSRFLFHIEDILCSSLLVTFLDNYKSVERGKHSSENRRLKRGDFSDWKSFDQSQLTSSIVLPFEINRLLRLSSSKEVIRKASIRFLYIFSLYTRRAIFIRLPAEIHLVQAYRLGGVEYAFLALVDR